VGLLAAAGAVGTFVFAVSVAGAAPTTDPGLAARREAPPSAMAAGVSGRSAASTPGASTPGLALTQAGDGSPDRPGTPSTVPTPVAPSTMGAAADDEDCRWCDGPHDGPDQDRDPDRWSSPTPTPTPAATPTPQPSPSDDLSMPTSGG
jgi:hypothetical protein